jgi:hypothetical protein
MKCHQCGARMRQRVVKPFGRERSVTVYACTNAQCEYPEDEYPGRRHWHERFR